MRAPAFFRPLALAAATTILLAGCGSAPPGGQAASPAAPATLPHYPFTVDNCGTKVTFAAAPKRVVTIKSTTTEMLLALGLGNRIVGSAFADGPVPQQWRQDVPVLSAQLPAQEPVLELEPDLVYAGWESNFSADGAALVAVSPLPAA